MTNPTYEQVMELFDALLPTLGIEWPGDAWQHHRVVWWYPEHPQIVQVWDSHCGDYLVYLDLIERCFLEEEDAEDALCFSDEPLVEFEEIWPSDPNVTANLMRAQGIGWEASAASWRARGNEELARCDAERAAEWHKRADEVDVHRVRH